MTVTILPVQSEEQIQAVRELFQEYAASQKYKPSWWEFEKELAELPGAYAPPNGRLLMAVEGGEHVGCVALQPLSKGVCQMKRLYVRPSHRNRGIGRRLAETIIEEARSIGYDTIQLDTVFPPTRMFWHLHFQHTKQYPEEPVPDAVRWMFDDAYVCERALHQ